MPDQFHQALSRLVELVEARTVPYMIVGAIAVAIWGRPRATVDIDVTVLADVVGLEAIAAHAAPFGFIVDREWLEWQPSSTTHENAPDVARVPQMQRGAFARLLGLPGADGRNGRRTGG